MVRIAVLGSGRLGSTLAGGLARAGHRVVVGSREGHRGADLPNEVATASIELAAASAEIVVNATPGRYSLDLFRSQPEGWLDGRVLLDVSNADDGAGGLFYAEGSLAERLQQAFPHASVVKALNTFNRTIMVDPSLLSEPTTVFVCGNDLPAKARVATLLGDLGWGADSIVDLGGVEAAQATEHMILMYFALRDALGTRDFNYRLLAKADVPVLGRSEDG